MQHPEKLEAWMFETPGEQLSLTDPDARSTATSGHGSSVVGYNVQAAGDTENQVIATHDVTMSGSGRCHIQ